MFWNNNTEDMDTREIARASYLQFEKDFGWQEQFYDDVREILIRHGANKIMTIEEANISIDRTECTDFIVELKEGTKQSIAVRIRNTEKYPIKYRELTVRAARVDSYGRRKDTELHKLRKGYGSIYLLIWVNDKNNIVDYELLDIDAMRKCGLFEQETLEEMHKYPHWNSDTTAFIKYTQSELTEAGAVIYSTMSDPTWW